MNGCGGRLPVIPIPPPPHRGRCHLTASEGRELLKTSEEQRIRSERGQPPPDNYQGRNEFLTTTSCLSTPDPGALATAPSSECRKGVLSAKRFQIKKKMNLDISTWMRSNQDGPFWARMKIFQDMPIARWKMGPNGLFGPWGNFFEVARWHFGARGQVCSRGPM